MSRKPAAATRKFRRETTCLVDSTTAGLRAAVAGSSLARVFVAATALLQRSKLGGDDIVIGLVGQRTRPRPGRSPHAVDAYKCRAPLRLHLDDAMTIDELLTPEPPAAIRAMMPHQRYPSQALRRDLRLLPMEAGRLQLDGQFHAVRLGSLVRRPSRQHAQSFPPDRFPIWSSRRLMFFQDPLS